MDRALVNTIIAIVDGNLELAFEHRITGIGNLCPDPG